jgi:hypothetical protein
MKKHRTLLTLFLILFCLLTFIPHSGVAHAAGTVTVSGQDLRVMGEVQRRVVTLSWTADASAATVPDTAIDSSTYGFTGWYLYSVETNPGSTAPTANHDIVINDADGVDIAGGLLMDRHTSTTQLVNIGNAVHGYPVVRGNLTVVWTNNAVNSATGTIILTFIPN